MNARRPNHANENGWIKKLETKRSPDAEWRKWKYCPNSFYIFGRNCKAYAKKNEYDESNEEAEQAQNLEQVISEIASRPNEVKNNRSGVILM